MEENKQSPGIIKRLMRSLQIGKSAPTLKGGKITPGQYSKRKNRLRSSKDSRKKNRGK